ncbi:MAG: hypothetical protein JSW28_04910, partial [Thermoplasmata archaeon]
KIGYSENYVSRTQEYGSFSVGVAQQHGLKSLARLDITAGLFGSSSEKFTISVPDYVVEWKKGGKIAFTVDNTNEYGNLLIKWNGAELYNKRASEGVHSIDIAPPLIKPENTLEISAQGPGLLFWAATVYEINDFVVNAEYGPAKFLDFEVTQDELESLNKFELKWYTTTRRGKLIVKVNGVQVYMDEPARQETVTFTDTSPVSIQISPGKNRLTMIAVNGSFELNDVLMNTYISKNQRTVKERFELTGEQVNMIKASGGVARIYVNEIERPGELWVKINEQGGGSTLAEAGWNTIKFKGELMEIDSNWIEVSGTGTFDVGDISVEVA